MPKMPKRVTIKVDPNSTSTQRGIPSEIRDSLKFVRKRFLFNVDQIEKRYCSNSSGLIFNLKNDEVDFDVEQCTAENDEDLLNSIKKELHKHTLDVYGGTALLSTPAEDPEENDENRKANWKKLNKLYDVYLSASIKEEVQNSAISQKALVPIRRRRGFIYTSAYQNNPANFRPKLENAQFPVNHYANDLLFPRTIKNGSVAESHVIDEPIILPLMPKFRTPRQYKNAISDYQSPMTRLKKRMLAIEESYDNRTDLIYAKDEDWVARWVNNTSAEEADLDLDLI